jgi:glycosyltransferase involved in cell wall biosynthesis
MKILFFSHYYPPEVNAPASRTFEHCVRWARAGHEVTVVTCVPNCPDGVVFDGYRNRWRRQSEMIDGVRVVRIWTYLAPNAGTVRRIANYVSYMLSAALASFRIGRPDVIIATSPQFFCGWAGVLVSWLKRRPLVLEIRDIWPESIRAVGALQNQRLLRLLERLEIRMYRAATHIVAVGGGYRDQILKKADVADRITVITNGVDLERFCQRSVGREQLSENADRSDRASCFVPGASLAMIGENEERRTNSPFICSYVGTIGMAHGLEVVIQAARMLKDAGRGDFLFQIVGDGARRQSLIDLAAEQGVSELVEFPGRQPKERMPAILAESDACLVHLRGCELFGTVIPSKIFEVMAMARPIIMGVRGEAQEIVLGAEAGLAMEPDSAESLVACLKELADHPNRAQVMGQAGRAYVAQHYDRNQLAKRYLKLLEDVAAADHKPIPRNGK